MNRKYWHLKILRKKNEWKLIICFKFEIIVENLNYFSFFFSFFCWKKKNSDPALLKRKWAVRKEEVVSSMPNAYETLVGEREADQRKKEIELDKKEREQERVREKR